MPLKTFFDKPVIWTNKNIPVGTIDTIELNEPWKHYVTFKYNKNGHTFFFTIAELEGLHKRALELIKEQRVDNA